MLKPLEFYSNGKLLLTAEYLVLDGAKALALPTKFGQNLHIQQQQSNLGILFWKSYDSDKSIWFETSFNTLDFEILNFKKLSDSYKKTALKLQEILQETKKLNPLFLKSNNSFYVETYLTFPRNWGLGTSSTLLSNIAKWANINPFTLQFKVFGGSAYDIACATNNLPVLYHLKNKIPTIKQVVFNPKFTDNLYFVYLNQKKNSRDAISHYKKKQFHLNTTVSKINIISKQFLDTNISLKIFEKLIQKHEQILSDILQIQPIKQQLFPDYFGAIKSLGAWEGDFILVTGNKNTPKYFYDKGYSVVLPFKKIILNNPKVNKKLSEK